MTQSGQEQRKLTVILSADVVGYSGLMEADEAGTLARLKANRRKIFDPHVATHGGRVFKLVGDCAMVEFSSPVSALRSALAVQEATARAEQEIPEAKRIRYRIGVNLGDVIIDGDDLYGDGVNVAARLQALAPVGGIAISKMVRDNVKGKLTCEFDDKGEHKVKNIEAPVHVFEVRPLQHQDQTLESPDAARRHAILQSIDICQVEHDAELKAGLLRWFTRFDANLLPISSKGNHSGRALLAETILREDLQLLKQLHTIHSTCGSTLQDIAEELCGSKFTNKFNRGATTEDLKARVSDAVKVGVGANSKSRLDFHQQLKTFVIEGLQPVMESLESRLLPIMGDQGIRDFFDFANNGLLVCAGRQRTLADFRVRTATQQAETIRTLISRQEGVFLHAVAQAQLDSNPEPMFVRKALEDSRTLLISVVDVCEFISLTFCSDAWGEETPILMAGFVRASAEKVQGNTAVFNLVKSSNSLIMLYISSLKANADEAAA